MSTVTVPNGQILSFTRVTGPGFINVQLSSDRGNGLVRARSGDYIVTFLDDSVGVFTPTQFANIFGSMVQA